MNDPQTITGPLGKILVLDEDPDICFLFARVSERNGIKAITVNNTDEAIQQYRKAFDSGQPFGKVILDLNIAGKTVAVKALGELKQIDPHVEAIVSSGDTFNEVMVNYEQFGFQAALLKPCQLQKLISIVLDRENKICN